MSELDAFTQSRLAAKKPSSVLDDFVESRKAQKQSAPSNAAVAASSAVKSAASIPDMFINAAPNLIGFGLAGTGFVSNELADVVGRDNGLGRYLSKVN